MVPEDVLAFAQIQNPDLFLTNVDVVAAKLGLRAMVFGEDTSIRDNLKKIKENSMGMADFSWIDLKNPMGVALLPGASPSEVGILVYVPVTSKQAAEGVAGLAGMAKAKMVPYQGYAVLAFNTKSEVTFPVAKPLNLSVLSEHEAGGLSWYANFDSVKNSFGYDPKEILSSFEDSMNSSTVLSTELGKEFLTAGLELVNAAKYLTGGISFDADALLTRSALGFNEGKIKEILGQFKASKGDLSYFKYIPESSILSFAGDLGANKDVLGKMSIDLSTWVLGLLIKDTALIEEYKALVNDSIKIMGTRFAFGFDMDVNPEALKVANESRDPVAMIKSFDFKLSMVMEISNKDAYMTYLEKALGSDLADRTVKAIFSNEAFQGKEFAMLMGTGIKYTFTKDLKDGDFTYSKIGFKVESETIPSELLEVMNKIYDSLGILVHVSNNNLFMVLGSDSLPYLKALATQNKASGKSLNEKPSFSKVLGKLPNDSTLVSNFNLARVFELLIKSGANQNLPTINKESAGWTGFFKLNEALLEGGLAIPMDDIKAAVEAGQELSSLFSRDNSFDNENDYDYESDDNFDMYSEDWGDY